MRLSVISFSILMAAPMVARAAAPEEERARAAFAEAVSAYKSQQLEAAARGFEESYQLAPNPLVLFNIGQTYLELGRWTKARRAFERYLREVNDLSPERHAEVEAKLQELQAHTAALSFEGEAGAAVELDGQSLGLTPLPEAEIVDLGAHTLTATKAGFHPFRQELQSVAGERQVLTIQMSPLPVAPPVLEPAPIAPRSSSSWRWVGWASSAVLAGGAVASTIVWAHASGELGDLKERRSSAAQREYFADRSNLFGGAAIGLGAAALATAGVMVAVTLKSSRSLSASAGPGSVMVHGSF